MTVKRIPIDPPIGRSNFDCRHCGTPIYAVAHVTYDDGQPDWFVYRHASDAEWCPSKTTAEPYDEAQAHTMVSAKLAVRAADGAAAARSAQSARVTAALRRLHVIEIARREHAEAGDRVKASAAAGALRGLVEDLPIHDLRSLTLRLFLDSTTRPAPKE